VSFRYRDGRQDNDISLSDAKKLILDAIAEKKQV
jgi:hypothetical protein